MPRQDPITGCSVMTMPEFLNSEAEREGKGRCGADILHDIHAELDEDSRKHAQRYKDNPALALTEILRYAIMDLEAWFDEKHSYQNEAQRIRADFKHEWACLHKNVKASFGTAKKYRAHCRKMVAVHGYDKPFDLPRPPMPVECRKVLESDMSQSMNSSGGKLVAECVCDDNKVRIATLTFSHWSGSRMEPPEDDSELTWTETP